MRLSTLVCLVWRTIVEYEIRHYAYTSRKNQRYHIKDSMANQIDKDVETCLTYESYRKEDDRKLMDQLDSLISDRDIIDNKMIDLLEAQIKKLFVFRELIDGQLMTLLHKPNDDDDCGLNHNIIRSPLYDDLIYQYIKNNEDLMSMKHRMSELHGSRVGCLAEESIVLTLNIKKMKDKVVSIKKTCINLSRRDQTMFE